MARYDKYNPKSGGFRAAIAAAAPLADLGKIFAVGLDTNGRVVKGGGNTGIMGIMVNTKTKAIGDIVDVMTAGEVVEAAMSDGTTAIAAGTTVYADPATGLLTLTATAMKKIGSTVEGGVIATTRLVVRVAGSGTAA